MTSAVDVGPRPIADAGVSPPAEAVHDPLNDRFWAILRASGLAEPDGDQPAVEPAEAHVRSGRPGRVAVDRGRPRRPRPVRRSAVVRTGRGRPDGDGLDDGLRRQRSPPSDRAVVQRLSTGGDALHAPLDRPCRQSREQTEAITDTDR